jgi:hypothetical protein
MTLTIRTPFLALALLAAAALGARAADDPKPEQVPAPPQAIVQTPETLPPVTTGRPVRARLMPDAPPAAAAGELAGLRAVALREGAAELSLDGVVRKVKIGDALGSGTVRAIGADRIVLERPFSVPGGTPSRATVIVTFGKGGVPRVRTIVDLGALPPPVPFEEAH